MKNKTNTEILNEMNKDAQMLLFATSVDLRDETELIQMERVSLAHSIIVGMKQRYDNIFSIPQK